MKIRVLCKITLSSVCSPICEQEHIFYILYFIFIAYSLKCHSCSWSKVEIDGDDAGFIEDLMGGLSNYEDEDCEKGADNLKVRMRPFIHLFIYLFILLLFVCLFVRLFACCYLVLFACSSCTIIFLFVCVCVCVYSFTCLFVCLLIHVRCVCPFIYMVVGMSINSCMVYRCFIGTLTLLRCVSQPKRQQL